MSLSPIDDQLILSAIDYKRLNSRQKEAYNFQKISAVLADFGYCTIRLSDDWGGADFIALHIDGSVLKVQLKGRLSFAKKYEGKGLYLCFPSDGGWYLYPHDCTLKKVMEKKATLEFTQSWELNRSYSFPSLGKELKKILAPYRIVEHNTGAIST